MRHPALLQEPFTPMTATGAEQFLSVVRNALQEDAASNDLSAAAVAPDAQARSAIIARADAVIAGLSLAALAFSEIDASVKFTMQAHDGQRVSRNAILAGLQGRARSILSSERVALNFVGILSGIATRTRAFVDAVAGLPVRISDTRKTAPGLRVLERYAVRAGGGYNHRFDLSSAVLIKDNHLAATGSIEQAVAQAKAHAPPGAVIEVECESLEQVHAAVAADVNAILLDNMSLERLKKAVAIARGHAVLEASGGITLDNVRAVAQTGVDVISIGALTYGAPWADVALDFEVQAEGKQA